jgi:UDP-N-acetylglucosamine 2-epimerase (non-hydrolysing)
MPKLKVVTILGTRPEIIRLSRVIPRLDEFTNHILVHTGQNYDYELNEIFFKDLELRKPDYFLNVDTSSLGSAVGDIIRKSEEVLIKEKPGALLVLGDTNSCLAAYMAKRLHIPIFHMEAGNRCFDENVPEEINRRIIDHIADFNLVYTEHARRHLLSEGLPHRRIYLTGSPMKEVLDYYKPKIEASKIAVSPENLKKIINILNALADNYKLPVIVSTHPRTRKRIEELSSHQSPLTTQHPSPTSHSSLVTRHSLIQFLKPFGFTDYVNLQMNAKCTISDSGTISEESAILSFPAISLRNSMERPEAQDAGTITLTGFDKDRVLNCIETVIAEHQTRKYNNNVADYSIADTSWRVLKLIQGLSGLSNKWSGISSK